MTYDINNLLEYNGYFGTVEYALDGNVFHGKVIGIDGLISYEGRDLDGLRQDFEGAIDEYFAMCKDEGLEPQKPYFSHLSVKIPLALHKNLADFSAKYNKTLNETVEEALAGYITA
ncbi:MAG: type II toxin-antitoxin system HicB family antitoxin [Defluviitaleaceae bacterium]|nr:type II toxin-antitoxin system HicB family antitoxin [Defluviitaleaceae bacterium]